MKFSHSNSPVQPREATNKTLFRFHGQNVLRFWKYSKCAAPHRKELFPPCFDYQLEEGVVNPAFISSKYIPFAVHLNFILALGEVNLALCLLREWPAEIVCFDPYCYNANLLQ